MDKKLNSNVVLWWVGFLKNRPCKIFPHGILYTEFYNYLEIFVVLFTISKVSLTS